jgi:hypothetical protein
MWYACAIALNSGFQTPPIKEAVPLAGDIRIEPIPGWVKDDEALGKLSWREREWIKGADLAFAANYDAEALGSPDPSWDGAEPKSIQKAVDEKFMLASISLWLIKPCTLLCEPVLHFSQEGDSASLRQARSLRPVLVRKDEESNIPSREDIEQAGKLLAILLSLRRNGNLWTALHFLILGLSELLWETRYLLQWIVLEALFGPDSAQETTYRLSQRIGLFIAGDTEKGKSIFENAKKAYSWRSKIVHGRRLTKLTAEQSAELSLTTESIIRDGIIKILKDPANIKLFDSKQREEFLDGLAFE